MPHRLPLEVDSVARLDPSGQISICSASGDLLVMSQECFACVWLSSGSCQWNAIDHEKCHVATSQLEQSSDRTPQTAQQSAVVQADHREDVADPQESCVRNDERSYRDRAGH